jgi:hypothetical protein
MKEVSSSVDVGAVSLHFANVAATSRRDALARERTTGVILLVQQNMKWASTTWMTSQHRLSMCTRGSDEGKGREEEKFSVIDISPATRAPLHICTPGGFGIGGAVVSAHRRSHHEVGECREKRDSQWRRKKYTTERTWETTCQRARSKTGPGARGGGSDKAETDCRIPHGYSECGKGYGIITRRGRRRGQG